MNLKPLLLAAMIGCSSLSVVLPTLRPQAAIAQNTTLAVRLQQLHRGMTTAQVQQAVGRPYQTTQETKGQKFLVWDYNISGSPNQLLLVPVRFKNGRLYDVDGGSAG